EPIRTLEELGKKHGYTLSLYPVDHPGQEQKATWLQIRRDRPDYTLMWGWGVMNQVAIQEAVNIRYPMDHFIGIWWSGSENDVLPAGPAANGYKHVTFHGVDANYPVFADIKKYVTDAGKAAGDGTNVGTALYNRGLYAAMLAVEAARTAMGIHNTKQINGEMMRDGMEALKLDQARMTELGLPGFGPEINVSCADHGGPGLGAIAQWDAEAKTWKLISDFGPADREVIDALIKEDSEAYAKENNIEPRACE
ncbi:MAG: ABC transporter substrate-binding protein, partial [Notoacmeibacter sp.]|nr:ABC transporter substrate-binding protein [Notoacmeibacter sp.]